MGVASYFADVARGVKTTVQGMTITFKQMFQRTTTVHYPEETREYAHSEYTTLGLRGIHGYDVDTCIACFQCANACPVDCIHIEHIHKGKHAIMTRFDIDYQKCLFCHLCVDPCPPHCLWMTEDFDLTGYTREDAILRLIDWSVDQKERSLQEVAENSQPVKWEKYRAEQAAKEAEEKEKAQAEAEGAAEGSEGDQGDAKKEDGSAEG